jgi:hypothetical protein
VAQRSPLLTEVEKRAIAKLAGGDFAPEPQKLSSIAVTATSLDCRASAVDITSRSCGIRFDHQAVVLKGREANELFATLLEVNLVPNGAAGSVFIGLRQLNCLVEPDELRLKGGGGVTCDFEATTG